MPAKLTPLKDLRILKHQIPAHGLTPNTSIQNKPLLIYKSVFASDVTAGEIETHLNSVGVVSPQWRYSMYTTSHFHVSIRMITCFVMQHTEIDDRRQHHMKSSVLRKEKRVSALDTKIIRAGWKKR
jgi:hypothetical protein